MAEYRVDALAAAAGVTVEVIRSYQSKGLLDPPRHAGRVAYYGERHLERLRTIRELKERGHALKAIATMLAEPPPRARREPRPPEDALDAREVADRAGVPPSLLRSLEASGLVRAMRLDDGTHYTSEDVRAVRMLLSLVGAGVPMEEFMQVARTQLDAATTVAEGAVELFWRYGRQPLLAAGLPAEQEAERLVGAFRTMVQAATGLIAYNIERMMLNLVDEELGRRGTGAEQDAFRRAAAGRRAGTSVPA